MSLAPEPPVLLVLASASPARLATLRAAGIDPTVLVSDVDEDAVLAAAMAENPALAPDQQVIALARAKARAVASLLTADDAESRLGSAPAWLAGGLVLGCDSMLELDGEVLGKPADADDAVRRITQQSGRRAVLHTGHWLIDLRRLDPPPPPQVGATSSTVVHFAELTASEIAAYVATGEPLAVAGAFTIDGLGGPFVRGVEGDHHGVIGLSLPVLRDLLCRLGLTVPQLWRPSLRPTPGSLPCAQTPGRDD